VFRGSSRFKWHHIYYILAAFDVATISFSLYLHHRILDIYEQSVVVNQEWAERNGRYGELAQLAALVNAPGNDVFASRDVNRESARLEESLRVFEAALLEVRNDLNDHRVENVIEAALMTTVDGVEAGMHRMVTASKQIFAAIEAGDTEVAGTHMAEMDRHYGQVRVGLDVLQGEVRVIQEKNFELQTAAATDVGRYEYLIAGFIVFIVGAVTLYGHKLARKLQSHQTERERLHSELEAAESLTRRYNEELQSTVREQTEGLRVALEKQSELARKNADAYEIIRRTQQELLRKERLAAVGELAAAVAHGIRNPLASIRAAAEVGREDWEEDSTVRETLDDIVTEVIRLEGRVRTVLDFSHPFEPDLSLGDVNDFLEDFAEGIRKRIRQSVRLDVVLAPSIPSLRFDRAHLHEIIEALVINAAEAMNGDGTVTIQSSIEPANGAGFQEIVISVADTGPGIEADRIGQIFDLFYTSKPSGTGIGLAMAKRLVESQGGRIHVVSEPGESTAFRLCFPAVPASTGDSTQR